MGKQTQILTVIKNPRHAPGFSPRVLDTLEDNSHKGKIVGNVGGLLIKELKYRSFRFYFIVDGKKLKVFSKEELTDLLIKFVRMSDKKSQQKVIDEIRKILIKIGPEGF